MAVARRGQLVRGILCVLVCLTAGAAHSSEASAVQPPEYLYSFGPDGSALTEFQRTGPIAVDQGTHAVYVRDPEAESLYRFDVNGSPLPFSGSAGNISGNEISGVPAPPSVNEESEVAVNSSTHVVYATGGNAIYAFQGSGEPAEFTAGVGAGTNEIGGFTRLMGVAVDANGAIYASDFGAGGSGTITVFAPSGEELTKFETAQPANIAVDNNGAVYVVRFQDSVFKFVPSEFPVTSTTTYATPFEPFANQSAASVSVDPATNDVYITRLFTNPSIAWYDENGGLIATFAGPGEEGGFFSSEGAAIDSASKRIFVSRNLQDGTSLVGIFGPEPKCEEAPIVGGSYASPVSAQSATLHATVNPCSSDTTYWFEYGPADCSVSECTRVPVGGAAVGSGHVPVSVSQVISGLQSNSTYHYRIEAKNAFGTRDGADRTFTTQVSGSDFSLIDSRVWEMVSPPNKQGAKIVASPGGVTEAAATGEGLAYLTLGSIEPRPEGNRSAELSSVIARRTGTGWQSKDITPPHTEATKLQLAAEYKLFSENLSEALLEPRDETPLAPEATEMTPYLRTNTEPASFTPLLNPGSLPPETHWIGPAESGEYVTIEGANSELTHIALDSRLPLVPGAETGALYLWAAGQVEAVSELPASAVGDVVTGVLGSREISVRHAISADGGRVFWSTFPSDTTTGLYLRDTFTRESVRLDVEQPGASGFGNSNPVFQAATPDGSVVFFTDPQQLTKDASPSGNDLYRCEIGPVGPGLGCVSLTDITAPQQGSGESSEVKEVIPGIGDDGRSAYFVATSVLDSGQNAYGDSAQSGEPNLYRWDQSEGVRFVAMLAEEDSSGQSPDDTDWGHGHGKGEVALLSALTSPNGRFLAFMSQRSLTGQENENPSSSEPIEEAFLYDATNEGLTCLSCKATGAAPDGELRPPGGGKNGESVAVDPLGIWTDTRVAATLPEGSFRVLAGVSLYQPRAVLNNGRTFFNSVDPLVQADSNGQWDVYQYEPEGAGGCTSGSSSSATSFNGGGCISLISSGRSEGPSAFLDSSTSGNDVFFVTPGALSALDEDTAVDIYDARVGGTLAVRTSPPSCEGGCQAPVAPPAASSPASAAFNGPGNVHPRRKHCPRGKRKVRGHHRKAHCAPKHRRHRSRSGNGRRVQR
jgi:hypothetical protein